MEWVILSLILIILIFIFLIPYLIYLKAFNSSTVKNEDPYHLPFVCNEKSKEKMVKLIDEMRSIPYEQVNIVSYDGTKISARYYHVSDDSTIQIQVHGYRGIAIRDFCGGNKLARENGYNTLLIDQRGHGDSKGKAITFGIKESKDVLCWIDYVVKRFGKDCKIVLCGVSMGASSILLASQNKLPSNVKAIVADCPFSSAKDIIIKVMKDMKLPAKLCYPFVCLSARIYGKFSLKDGDVTEAIKKCQIPVLLIHGEKDELVPAKMSVQMYESNPEVVRLELFKDATHGLSYIVDNERYERICLEFLKSYD